MRRAPHDRAGCNLVEHSGTGYRPDRCSRRGRGDCPSQLGYRRNPQDSYRFVGIVHVPVSAAGHLYRDRNESWLSARGGEEQSCRGSQAAQIDVRLQVGQTSDSVVVSAAGAELIDTSSAGISGTVTQKLIDNLPPNGRNFFDAAAALPHVSLQNLGSSISFAGFALNAVFGANVANPIFRATGIFAAGNRDSATNVAVDGVNVQTSVYGQTMTQSPRPQFRR